MFGRARMLGIRKQNFVTFIRRFNNVAPSNKGLIAKDDTQALPHENNNTERMTPMQQLTRLQSLFDLKSAVHYTIKIEPANFVENW